MRVKEKPGLAAHEDFGCLLKDVDPECKGAPMNDVVRTMEPDPFYEGYEDYLDGKYDCVDRIVLNAYFKFAQSGAGFRAWWRILHGGDENLNETNVRRYAGRFSRRIQAYTEKNHIPLVFCEPGERKHETAEGYLPSNRNAEGVFCILASRAPGAVREIRRFGKNGIDIRRKKTSTYVNHYFFHIMDREWGHMTIRFCPHPPFNALIILNGHEYVERKARSLRIPFEKEDNCFTSVPNAAGLTGVADTMSTSCAVGRLVKACERWMYSACLCFALDLEEQKRCAFRYSYSVCQTEYSRNFLFQRGRVMDRLFNAVIEHTRGSLDVRQLKTIFGRRKRPHKRAEGKTPRLEIVVEKPVYNLTVFKVHFGKLTLKIYSKGERVLRLEAIAHNTADLRCGKSIEKFPDIVVSLRAILQRFLMVIRCIDASFVDASIMESWPQPGKLGTSRVAGMDINQGRIRAVMNAVIALSPNSKGFNASLLAKKAAEIMGVPEEKYAPRNASYDLRKLRAKNVVSRLGRSRRYEATPEGLRTMSAILTIRDKVLIPLLANAGKREKGRPCMNQIELNTHYRNIQGEMQNIFKIIGIAA